MASLPNSGVMKKHISKLGDVTIAARRFGAHCCRYYGNHPGFKKLEINAHVNGELAGVLHAYEVIVPDIIKRGGYFHLGDVFDEDSALSEMCTFVYGTYPLGLGYAVRDRGRRWKTFSKDFQKLAVNFDSYSKPTHQDRWSDWSHTLIYVESVEVYPAYRNAGIGSMLVEGIGKDPRSMKDAFVVLKCYPFELGFDEGEESSFIREGRDSLAKFYTGQGFVASKGNYWMLHTRAQLFGRSKLRCKQERKLIKSDEKMRLGA